MEKEKEPVVGVFLTIEICSSSSFRGRGRGMKSRISRRQDDKLSAICEMEETEKPKAIGKREGRMERMKEKERQNRKEGKNSIAIVGILQTKGGGR